MLLAVFDAGCFTSSLSNWEALGNGAAVSAVTSQQEGSSFDLGLQLGVEFTCSPYTCVGFFQVLRILSTVQRHADKVNSKLRPL